jgi:hypothetical protein
VGWRVDCGCGLCSVKIERLCGGEWKLAWMEFVIIKWIVGRKVLVVIAERWVLYITFCTRVRRIALLCINLRIVYVIEQDILSPQMFAGQSSLRSVMKAQYLNVTSSGMTFMSDCLKNLG